MGFERTLSFSLISLCSLCQAVAQRSLHFENYSSNHGLSQLSCYALAQDPDGFIWVGTQDGLNRYDGQRFDVYTRQHAEGDKLPSNAIFSLHQDTNRQLLWIGTSGGLGLYDLRGDSLARLTDFFPFAADLEKLPIKKIVSFETDGYWVIAFNNGLFYLNTATASVQSFFTGPEYRSDVTDVVLHDGKIIVSLLYTLHELVPQGNAYRPAALLDGYQFPQIESIASYDRRLWVGTIVSGCYSIGNPFHGKGNVVASHIVAGGVYCFAVDAENRLWIGTRGNGIYRYDAATGLVVQAMHNQFVPASLASNFVVSILKDRQGNMWCGLSGGLSKYDPLSHQFGFVNGPTSLNGSLLDKVIYSMYRTRDGSLYIGTQNRGLFEWDTASDEFVPFPGSAIVGQANNVIYGMTEDDRGTIWAATFGGLMQLDRRTKRVTYHPENVARTKLNKLYAVTKPKKADGLLVSGDDGLHFFSLAEKRWMPFPRAAGHSDIINGFAAFKGVRHFHEDEDNTLWLCAPGSGLIRYRYLENELEAVEAVNAVSSSVRHLLADGDTFLLATDHGLVVYDRKADRVLKQVDVNANGVSNVCYAIQKDDQGFYWVSTNTGLRKVNGQYDVVQVYNDTNGLAFLEYNTACTSKGDGGLLYFGGMGGITFFDPAALKPNLFTPQPIITRMTVNDAPLSPTVQKRGDIRLRHDENFISFQFTVTNFSNEKNNRFSYRLNGLNDHWSALSTADKAGFTSLPPGAYVFELRAVNSDGHWSEVTALALTVLRPWWQTWWFIAAACGCLVGLAAWLIRRRIRIIRKESLLKQQLAEAEMTAMRAQMNPHFVFNSLNSIREMILSNENETASHFLGRFAGLIRITLEQSGKSFVTLRQSIAHLARYMEIEQIRNGEFTNRISVDEALDLDEVLLPSMLIQPFVENALWHGTTADRKNIHIHIAFKKERGRLRCIVEDDGIGIRQSLMNKAKGNTTHHSLGLENIAHRIRLLNEKHGLESSMRVDDKEALDTYAGTGTVVQLILPLQIDKS